MGGREGAIRARAFTKGGPDVVGGSGGDARAGSSHPHTKSDLNAPLHDVDHYNAPFIATFSNFLFVLSGIFVGFFSSLCILRAQLEAHFAFYFLHKPKSL